MEQHIINGCLCLLPLLPLDFYDYSHYPEYGVKFEEVKETWDFVNKNSRMFHGEFILLIKEYNSINTPKDKLIEIFKQSGINVVFTNDVFNNLPSQMIKEQVEEIKDMTIHSIPQQETEEENKLLREKLLQAEEKIKQLEEEVLTLLKRENILSF
jgi:hypothetical protein